LEKSSHCLFILLAQCLVEFAMGTHHVEGAILLIPYSNQGRVAPGGATHQPRETERQSAGEKSDSFAKDHEFG
jgi:hypothetical protein